MAEKTKTEEAGGYSLLEKLVEDSIKTLNEGGQEPADEGQFTPSLPSIFLMLAIYGFDLMKDKPTEEEVSRLLAELSEHKDKLRLDLYKWTEPQATSVPSEWEPDVLLEPIALSSSPVHTYYYFTVPAQLLWARLMVYAALRFNHYFRDLFSKLRLDVCSFLLDASYAAWAPFLSNNQSASLPSLVAHYDHVRGFLRAPEFTFPRDSPASYPSPKRENASRAPQALLYTLNVYHWKYRSDTTADNIEETLEPLILAFSYICRYQLPVTLPSLAPAPLRQLAEDSKRITERLNARLRNVNLGDNFESLRKHFLDTCGACKNTKPPVLKQHLFLGWEELEMIFRFAWVWKQQPSPKSLEKLPNRHDAFAKLLMEWASDLKPTHRWDTALTLYNLMQTLCRHSGLTDRAARLANECLPELNFLLPPLTPDMPPHRTIFVISPLLARRSLNVLKPALLSYFRSKGAQIQHQEHPRTLTAAPADRAQSTAMDISTPENGDALPFASPHDLYQWSILKSYATSQPFIVAAKQLAQFYRDHPGALSYALDSAANDSATQSTLLYPIFRSAFTAIRLLGQDLIDVKPTSTMMDVT